MINPNSLSKLFTAAACIVACSTGNAQETVTLQEDGSLVGKAFVSATSEAAAEAKMTLSQDGQVISTVSADEQGNFSFQNIEPGSYEVLGASDPFVGQASYEVAPFSSGGCSSCSMGLSEQPAEVSYSTCGSAPAQSFSSSCSSCGGGLGGGGRGLLGGGGRGLLGGGGGGLLGGGGGGLFSSPLVRLGAIGGIVAIATSDDDDDASPDN